MQIGIGLANKTDGLSPGTLPEWAARAERHGFASLGSTGRMAYPGVMDTVALAAAAGVTSRIELISSLLIAPAWPPALLAIELAGIDAISGGRLTVGLGLGVRADDYPVAGLGPRGVGARLDRDLPIYESIWAGEQPGGAENPFVHAGARRLPLLFGGNGAPAAFARMARWGSGYLAPSVPPAMAGPLVSAAREAWARADRAGDLRVVGIAYSGLTDPDAGRESIRDYYAATGAESVELVQDYMCETPASLREVAERWRELGADDLIVLPARAELEELDRIADALL